MKILRLVLPSVLAACAVAACRPDVGSAPQAAAEPVPADSPLRRVVLAGGCFWCTEAVFEELAGIESVVSGYAGGEAETATYGQVSAGTTDHAEAIQVIYDPDVVTRGELLDVFFAVAHDPTQVNRQGPDRGRQYRSAVFFADEAQRAEAADAIARLEEAGAFDEPIATTLEPLDAFYPAEESHQDFVRRNPRHPYVVRYALPKLDALENRFPALLRAD